MPLWRQAGGVLEAAEDGCFFSGNISIWRGDSGLCDYIPDHS